LNIEAKQIAKATQWPSVDFLKLKVEDPIFRALLEAKDSSFNAFSQFPFGPYHKPLQQTQ
jgi:hypothetical protein